MENKKKYWLLIIPLVIFLALVIYLLTANLNKIPPPSENKKESPSAGTETPAVAPIDNSGAVSACLKDGNQEDASICLSLLAQTVKDEKVCGSIIDAAEAEKCLEMTIFGIALENKDISPCSRISDFSLSKSCVSRVLESGDLKEADCQSLPDREKTNCLEFFKYAADIDIFKNAKNSQDCQAISDETVKIFCLDNFK
jgi:hypothetical protein